ncbi:MAG: hypothetical protein QW103_02000 [Candidatus Pacearchaeota archaeon]
MVKNKKGWLRIFEAFLAVILVLGAVLVLNTIKKEDDKEKISDFYINEIKKEITKEILTNEEIRRMVISREENGIKNKLKNLVGEKYEINVRVCNLTEKYCFYNQNYPQKDVFVEDVIISGNITLYQPLRVRVFLWKKD